MIMRYSKQREMILNELKQRMDHPTAEELYLAVKHRLPNLSLGTVYRNLEQLARGGVISQLEFAGGQKRFDADTDSHHHFRCLVCNRVEDIPFTPVLPEKTQDHPWLREREVYNIHFGYSGLCPQCKQKRFKLKEK